MRLCVRQGPHRSLCGATVCPNPSEHQPLPHVRRRSAAVRAGCRCNLIRHGVLPTRSEPGLGGFAFSESCVCGFFTLLRRVRSWCVRCRGGSFLLALTQTANRRLAGNCFVCRAAPRILAALTGPERDLRKKFLGASQTVRRSGNVWFVLSF